LVSAYVSAFANAAADPVAKSGLLPEDAKLLVERARAVKGRVGVASLCSQEGERGWSRLLAFY
jgi:hypothetical protein